MIAALLVLLATSTLSSATVFGTDVRTCVEKNGNLEGCIKESLSSLGSHLKEGIPSLNVSPMEPFLFQDFSCNYEPVGINLVIDFSPVWLDGLSTLAVENVVIDRESRTFELRTSIEKLTVRGNYSMKGDFFGLSIQDSGPFKNYVYNWHSNTLCTLELSEEGRPNVVSADTVFGYDDFEMNLFGEVIEDPFYGRMFSLVTQHYGELVMSASMPAAHKLFNGLVLKILPDIFSQLGPVGA